MTEQEIRPLLKEMNEMILQGKILDAFDKFYAPDVVMQDNDYPQRVGFDVNRQYEERFVNGLTEFRGAKVKEMIVSEGVSAVEWWFDYTHSEFGVMNYHQIAVQRWKNGKIVEEKFYYNAN